MVAVPPGRLGGLAGLARSCGLSNVASGAELERPAGALRTAWKRHKLNLPLLVSPLNSCWQRRLP
eukprot:11350775-Alexandrium_andersonii.AAC.1